MSSGGLTISADRSESGCDFTLGVLREPITLGMRNPAAAHPEGADSSSQASSIAKMAVNFLANHMLFTFIFLNFLRSGFFFAHDAFSS